jgi:hypothetical protein
MVRIPDFNRSSTASSKTPSVIGTLLNNPNNEIISLKTSINRLRERIKVLNNTLSGFNGFVGAALGVFWEGNYYTFAAAREILSQLRQELAVLERRLSQLTGAATPSPSSTSTGGTITTSTPPEAENVADKPVIYNASAANDVYFKADQSFFKTQTDPLGYARGETGIDSNIYAGNTPKTVVTNAIEIWENSSSGKGMIQTRITENGARPDSTANQSSAQFGDQKTFQRYGFQFIYNPETISMDYSGVPSVDAGMMASGTEEYNNLSPTSYQSTISFNILLNRIFDMQYLGKGGKLKGGIDVSKIYSGKIPTDKDLKTIYNKGTMYDIEFLLQTMFGTEAAKTDLRGKTWDIGYLGPQQVELHLGNKLRYAVLIQNISVQHAFFDHRMVPMFSYVSISCKRVPDVATSVISNAAAAGATNLTRPPGLPGSADAAERWLMNR